MKENIGIPLVGGIAGASVYSTIGGMGIVGGFGGLGIGIAGMTAAGTVVGFAVYGAVKGIEDGDALGFAAIGLGAMAGANISATIGVIGVSFGGSAFGIGMGSMAAMGGIFGLGIYGLAKMFSSSHTSEPIAATFNRMEARIAYEEAYYQAMMELSPTLAELAWKQKFSELELEEELEILKSQIRAKERLNLKWNIYNNSFDFIDHELEDYFINTEPESLDIELKENFVWKSVKTLRGHTAAINSLATKDNIIASASDDKIVSLWNLETGNLLQTLQASSPVIFSDNGKYLITGSSKNQIEIWQRLSVNHQLTNDSLITKEWWSILGVEQNASLTEIKTAYYNLARQYHPDINSSKGAEKMMQIINQAYHQSPIRLSSV